MKRADSTPVWLALESDSPFSIWQGGLNLCVCAWLRFRLLLFLLVSKIALYQYKIMWSLFKRIFNKHTIETPSRKGESSDSTIISAPGHASYVASEESLDMGNKVFHKDYQAAIDEGLEALRSSPNDPMLHINLMDAYSKGRQLNPDYLDKSTEHAKLAMINGHHTGYAEYRLAVNLEKKRFYHQSIQLYNLILETPGFHFTKCGMGNGIDFKLRKEKAEAKLPKANDSDSDRLFSEQEITRMITGIRDADLAEEKRQQEFKKSQEEFLEKILKMK